MSERGAPELPIPVSLDSEPFLNDTDVVAVGHQLFRFHERHALREVRTFCIHPGCESGRARRETVWPLDRGRSPRRPRAVIARRVVGHTIGRRRPIHTG